MSEARIIAVVAQKGGAGKTTVTMCLAGTLAARGHKVAVIDMDPQQTAMRWSGASQTKPFGASVVGMHALEARVGPAVQKIVADYDFILVDCPPSVQSNVPKAVMAFADIVLVPTRPSGPDLWATAAMVELIDDVRAFRGDELPALIVPTQVQSRTEVGKAIISQLRKSSVPASSASLAIRTAYQQAALVGLALEDLEGGAAEAVREISALADEVLAMLEVGAPVHATRSA